MRLGRCLAFALAAALLGAGVSDAAELPTQSIPTKKPKPAGESAKTCNIAGISGVLLANGVCVKMSGYISTGFGVGQVK
jgi:hypothetical protein